MTAPMEEPVPIGSVIQGKYRVDGIIGAGAMGVVVVATHLQLRERVALKFLLPGATRHKDAGERFMREARAAARLKTEHIARVIDVGSTDNGMAFMVMEFLEGRDLSRLLSEEQKLPVPVAIDF